MVFPVISKFNAELVVNVLSCCARDNVKYIFKHFRASNSKANSSDSLFPP